LKEECFFKKKKKKVGRKGQGIDWPEMLPSWWRDFGKTPPREASDEALKELFARLIENGLKIGLY